MNREEDENQARQVLNERLRRCLQKDWETHQYTQLLDKRGYPLLSRREKLIRTGLWLRRVATNRTAWVCLLIGGVWFGIHSTVSRMTYLERQNDLLASVVNSLSEQNDASRERLFDELYLTGTYRNRLREVSESDYAELWCRQLRGGLERNLVHTDYERFAEILRQCSPASKTDLTKP